ncbi:unnamed protein product [Mytilus coruscus]|uniref:C2H2-type domain-containing protein n=1 Tax=Mytilus coruscus TaxID=42192 RepID=A0A6J8BPQ6_MYTCO|nr:unnamed protein product [Mytilus coruscus]
MERQHWCSFCLIPFNNELSLRAHLNIHEKQPPVPCSLCPLTFVHHSQLGNHIRYRHSDYIINTFIENAERNCRKNITDIKSEIESDFEWTDSSEGEDCITSSEGVEFSEENYKIVTKDYERTKEAVQNIPNEMNYIFVQNVNDVSDTKNPVSEFDLKETNTKHMNNSDGRHGKTTSCDVSFLVKLEREKAARHLLEDTRIFSNFKDNLPLISTRHTLLQHLTSVNINSEEIGCIQRPGHNFEDDKNDLKQSTWDDGVEEVDGDKDEMDYEQNKAMTEHGGAGANRGESIRVNKDHEIAVADVVYRHGQAVWKEAIDILKDTFMKKKKGSRNRGRFASENTVSFAKWLTANFPVEGVICGCGRNFKTPKSVLCHLRRKSLTARKHVNLFKNGI